MSQFKKFLEIKEETERLKKKVSQAEGSIQQLKNQLYKQYLCKSVKEAKEMLEKIQEQEDFLDYQIEEKVKCLISGYSHLVEKR